MVWTIIFAGLKGRPVRTWVSILMIALQVILLTVINWLVFLCFGILLIFLSMYSSITERTREIGILRSLGASKAFVAALVIKETLVISLIGILIGSVVLQGRFLPRSEPRAGFRLKHWPMNRRDSFLPFRAIPQHEAA